MHMERFKKIMSGQRGFTLIEMMVVVTVIAILIGAGFKFFQGYIAQTRIRKAYADFSRMQTGLEAFYASMGYYPSLDIPNTDFQTDMAMAGMSPDVVATDVSGVSLYKYENTSDDDTAYKLYTPTKFDDKNYVIATGDSGTPFAPALALTTQ